MEATCGALLLLWIDVSCNYVRELNCYESMGGSIYESVYNCPLCPILSSSLVGDETQCNTFNRYKSNGWTGCNRTDSSR